MMMDSKAVFQIREYGRVCLKLKEILAQRGMTRYQLSKLADTRFEVIDKWCNKPVEKIDADVLARICFVLECGVGDLLEYKR